MGLQISFVESLNALVPSVTAYLEHSSSRDIFAPEHIIVPNAGVRSWLLQQIAQSVGVGPAGFDGIAANVNIGYLGQLDAFIGRRWVDDDPWSVGPLAVSILAVISREGSPFVERIEKMGGGLKAARALADRFDRYQARRPSMIREWEKGNAVLAPEVGGEVSAEFDGGHLITTPHLAESDRWQFDVWREVRSFIGVPPWPVEVASVAERLSRGEVIAGVPDRLLVVGLQSLSVRHIELLQALSHVADISVVLVHPSPVLAAKWSAESALVPVSPGIAPKAAIDSLPEDDVDELAFMWLRGSREAQMVLASQGLDALVHPVQGEAPADTLLRRVQASVSSGTAIRGVHAANDMSIRLHRAHNLSRQVEILHDALLHAFHDIPGLEPHDVVVLCANIEEAAPLLEAVFDRGRGGPEQSSRLPLVVADRSLRDVDDGASLLMAVLKAVRGRFSIDDVMAVATSEVVMRAHGVSADVSDAWSRIVGKSAVRWGASTEHRARLGVDVPEMSAHTWSLAIDRAMLGAVLPDAEPGSDLAGVVPLVDIDASDVPSITVLSRILTVLSSLEAQTSGGDRSIEEWADMITETLGRLGDAERGDLDDALAAVDTLRSYARYAAGPHAGSTPVSFSHAADLIEEIVSGAPGRQPLRTGAITATSLVPLRGVPFKVVCLVGFDEGTVPSGDADGDDLLERQKFAGDVDSRLEFRRSILDAVCSASERLIVTCNGKSIRNNADLPLITPLAEFVDMCQRCGATITSLEHHHPRHFSSPRNFRVNGVVDGIVWSHDEVALAAASRDGAMRGQLDNRGRPAQSADRGAVVISPSDLHRFVADPLHAFVATSLGINTWVDKADEATATIPLNVDEDTVIDLCDDLSSALLNGFTEKYWDDVQTTAGNFPPGVYGTDARSVVKARVRSMHDRVREWGVDLNDPMHVSVQVSVGSIDLAGVVTVYPAADGRLATVSFRKPSTRYPAIDRMALDLLLLRAAGHVADGVIVTRHDDADKCIARHVELAGHLTADVARDRVEHLVSLYQRAMESPCPLFGKTALSLNDDEAPSLFAKAVGDATFLGTKECLVYGPLPTFEEVYPLGGVERDFFNDFSSARLTRSAEAERDAGNAKPPVSGKAVKRYVFQ